jgi:calcineurin-like phosphoesterase family protein
MGKFPEHTYMGTDKKIGAFFTIDFPVRAVLCHYPFASWDGAAHNVWHFHGHTHNNHTLSDRHRINVSVENINYTPAEIHSLINAQIKIMEQQKELERQL